jgi:transposase
MVELEAWLREQRTKLSRNNDTTKAINYCLSRWDAFSRFLDDGRLCMSNNAAERELRAGRKNWTFAGSDEAAGVRLPSTVSSPRPYAALGIGRFMPPAELCRTDLVWHAVVTLARVDRVQGSPIPFGIVWSFKAPRGRQAGGRSAGSGFACRARTA